MEKFSFKEEITKDMIEWIVATKDSKTKEYYKQYYSDYFDLTDDLAGQIVREFFFYDFKEELVLAMRLLYMDLMLIEMNRGTDKFTYNEIFWYAWKSWCFHLTRTKLTEMFGDKWQPIFDRLRSEYNDKKTE